MAGMGEEGVVAVDSKRINPNQGANCRRKTHFSGKLWSGPARIAGKTEGIRRGPRFRCPFETQMTVVLSFSHKRT